MILGDMVGAAAESPGSNAARQEVTYALENRRLRSPPLDELLRLDDFVPRRLTRACPILGVRWE